MIILSTLGSHGDLYPFLKLADILKGQDREVLLLTSDAFAHKVKEKDFRFHSIMTLAEHKSLVDETLGDGIIGTHQYEKCFLKTAVRLIKLVVEEFGVDKVELIITNLMPAFGAKILEERYQIPFIQTQLTPFTVPTQYHFRANAVMSEEPNLPGKIFNFLYFQTWEWFRYFTLIRPLQKMRTDIGLTTPMGTRHHFQWLGDNAKTMAFFPKFFVNPLPSDWPLENSEHLGFPLYDPKSTESLPESLEKFLLNDKPTVLFARSTIYRGIHDEHKKFFKDAIEICEQLEYQGLFVHLFPDNIPKELPDNIFYIDFTCYDKVFPLVDCIIHQGGIGTVAQAIKHSKPQLIVPLIFDQFANADFVTNLGVGNTINYSDLSVENAVTILKDLLNNKRYHKACHQTAKQAVASNADFFDVVRKVVDDSLSARKRDAL